MSFDNCGIGSLRLDFNVKEEINVDDLIDMFMETCTLSDEPIFNIIKAELEKTKIKTTLVEHATYTVISSINNNQCVYTEEEIFGVAWKYWEYWRANDKLIAKINSNNIANKKDDTLLVTTQSTLMIFFEKDLEYIENYIEERVNAIELFWRQKYLLKNLDFKIGNLFKKIDKEVNAGNLDSAINEIKETQVSMHSELEAYRNTKLSVTHSFSILFETLNNVFDLNKHYTFVETKLNACDSIYQGFHDEQRNKLMENIQVVVIFLGVGSILLVLMTDVIYGGTMGPNQKNNIILTISLFLISPILFFVYNKWYKKVI